MCWQIFFEKNLPTHPCLKHFPHLETEKMPPNQIAMKILFCTLEDVLLTTLEYRFRKKGWQLSVAKTARRALDMAKKELPDVLVIDLELPEYEGLDIVQHFRKQIHPTVPLLTIAPAEEESLLFESLRLGANDFILKPLKPDELMLRIRRWLA